MKIKETVDIWHKERAERKTKGRKRESDGIIEEHAPLPLTANTYYGGVLKFLEMLEEQGISGDQDISKLSMEYFIHFPAWLTVYISPKTERTLSIASQRIYIIGAMKFYAWLQVQNLLIPTPLEETRFRIARTDASSDREDRKPRKIIRKDIQTLLKYCDEYRADSPIRERNIAIVFLMAYSGLRIHEVCKIKLHDIDFENSRGTIIGKGKKEAFFRLNRAAMRRLKAYLEVRGWGLNPDDPVFAAHDKSAGTKNPKHRHLTRSAVSQMIDSLSAAAGVHVWPHALRHFFITNAYEKKKDTALTQELARHARWETTKGYIDLLDREVDEKYREIFDD